MISISPLYSNQINKSVSFEKSPKEIIKEAPNKELKEIAKDLTYYNSDFVVDYGVPDLLKYAQRGPVEKEQAIQLITDVVESEEVRKNADSYTFNGCDVKSMDTDEVVDTEMGLKGAYEQLTGQKLDINI